MPDSAVRKPKGIAAVIVYPDGREVCSESTFETGFCNDVLGNLKRAQEQLIDRRIKWKFFHRLTMHHLGKTDPSDYFLDQFWSVAETAGFKLIMIPINHGGEDA